LYKFNFGKFDKIRDFFAEVTNSRSIGKGDYNGNDNNAQQGKAKVKVNITTVPYGPKTDGASHLLRVSTKAALVHPRPTSDQQQPNWVPSLAPYAVVPDHTTQLNATAFADAYRLQQPQYAVKHMGWVEPARFPSPHDVKSDLRVEATYCYGMLSTLQCQT